MKLFRLFAAVAPVLFPLLSLAQTFEVASVRLNVAGNAGGEGRQKASIVTSPGSFIARNVTLRTCLKWAYGIRDFQISGEPGWFSNKAWDITAKSSRPDGDEVLRTMLRALLADRFHLTVREESKQLPVYALLAGKGGPKLRTATGTEPASMRPGEGVLEFHNVSMADFAERLASRPLSVDRPVVEKTGLPGGYDFSLRFAENAASLKSALEEIDRGGGQSIFTAIQEQLGLKLEAQKAALPVFVVEHAEEFPGEN